MAEEVTAASSVAEALGSSSAAAAAELERTASSGTAASGEPTEKRIGDLMSKWQRADHEVQRLQGLLATAVADNERLNSAIREFETGGAGKVQEAEERIGTVTARASELETKLAEREAELAKLRVIAQNPDLAPYAAILPATTDTDQLNRAIATIRDARGRDIAAVREHLTTPARGGSPSRGGTAKLSPSEIAEYLRSAPAAEFETRLREVTGRS